MNICKRRILLGALRGAGSGLAVCVVPALLLVWAVLGFVVV
jgi:hypothetical protein